MPVELQIIRACEFVRLGTHGEFDFESTCEALEILAAACHKRGAERSIIDVRGATSNLTPKELAALVGVFARAAVSKRLRLAILHKGDQNYRAKLFAFFSAMRGRKVKAFEDFEEALVWLSTSEGKEPRTAAAERAVPIQTAKGSVTSIPVKDGDR